MCVCVAVPVRGVKMLFYVQFYRIIIMRQPPVWDRPAASHSDILMFSPCLMCSVNSMKFYFFMEFHRFLPFLSRVPNVGPKISQSSMSLGGFLLYSDVFLDFGAIASNFSGASRNIITRERRVDICILL